jgi:CubicO group peptidase (beta-lactamase class C family)
MPIPDQKPDKRVVESSVGDLAVQLESKARLFVREHRLPGVAAGVVYGDQLVWSSGIGFADIAARRPPDAATLYRIASITKTFSGTAILQLRDEGLLHLDDPATKYLPELNGADSAFGPIETVTIRRMLSHESGLMGDPPGTEWSQPVYEAEPAANFARIAEIGTRVPPSTQQKYSNLAYQLLGEIVTRISGVPYAEYVRTRILAPLGLSSTSFDPLPDDLAGRRATGYAARGFSDDLRESVAAPTSGAEGGLWSCVEDLALWLAFQVREGTAPRDDTQVLAGSTLAEMHRARYLGDEAWTEAWCISWYAHRRGDVAWIQHSGGLHGFNTNICFDPKERVGAIALVNGEADASVLAMDMASLARDAVRASPPTIEPPAPIPAAWRELLGLYAALEYSIVVRLEWRDSKLTFIDPPIPDWKPTLAPTEDSDVFIVDPGVRESGEPCTFRRRADGRIRSVTLGSTLMLRLDPVE